MYLRLPSVWKDLWVEMAQIQKERQNALDRDALRELRQITSTGNDSATQELTTSITAATNGTTVEPKVDSFRRIPATADDLKRIWADKAASPAFVSMARSRSDLPIYHWKTELLKAMTDHQVVIVCGETGCGKSTQVPAYILEHEMSNGRDCKIYCTEPRRISAITLARRVSEEMGERKNDIGTSRSLVGFAVRLDSRQNEATRLVYATTGIVMRMLESSRNLDEVTHLILDEVHERR